MKKYKTIFGKDNGSEIIEPIFFSALIFAENEIEAKEKAGKLYETYIGLSNVKKQMQQLSGYGMLTTEVQ
ncbi:hypothetical protein [uncultured Aquimarina sp.]|uniref:hypothetical protein n=1 Tax=uncultured Aquimarina sp. TaxID=575652 RepID=UPI0026133CE1|nr:hypothetical protein [uncultured Aquimarina sp.]